MTSMTTDSTTDLRRLLIGKEVCELLQISDWTLWKMRKAGRIPFIRLNGETGQTRYHQDQIDRLMRGQET